MNEYYSLIDVPAYHNARFAIDEVKNNKNKKKDVDCINVKSDNTILDNLINSALSLCNLIKSNWTDKQMIVVDLSIKQKKSQIEIGEILNIKQPSVNCRFNPLM